jgi:hypothetical protein
LPAEFVRSQVIGFAVGFSGDGMRVGCKVVEFRGSVVVALGHDVLLASLMQANSSRPITTFVVAGKKSTGSILVAHRQREWNPSFNIHCQ